MPWLHETPEQTSARRTALVKELTIQHGFSRVGVALASALTDDRLHLQRWLDQGRHASMAWLLDDVDKRCDPGLHVAGAQAVVVLALDYDTAQPRTREVDLAGGERGWISRYAWGTDYHLVVEKRLRRLVDAISAEWRRELGDDFRGPGGRVGPFKSVRDLRFEVDHGPVLERAWAVRAGLGWRGKHSLVVHPQHGSFFFLATMVTSVALDPDPPMADHCGSCTACLDACPTQAIVAPYVVDACRCISHATIETEGRIPEPERSLVGDHVFGCDLCQDVCPWNRFSKPCGEAEFDPRPGNLAPLLKDLHALNETAFAERFAQSPLKRRGIDGLRDNVQAVREGRLAPSTAGQHAPQHGDEQT
ncbi:MAG: tRNA epoxyqueuosine(34) reductase QueG [Myxococcota bacterium]